MLLHILNNYLQNVPEFLTVLNLASDTHKYDYPSYFHIQHISCKLSSFITTITEINKCIMTTNSISPIDSLPLIIFKNLDNTINILSKL